VTGIARVEDHVTHAKLKVNFVPSWLRWTGIGNGDYWIIDLDKDYTYAVVSEPTRKYLWILSRTPTMSQATYKCKKSFVAYASMDQITAVGRVKLIAVEQTDLITAYVTLLGRLF
jgi:lipocalin